MAIEGVDSSYDPPTAAELKAGGKKFSIRYVSTPGHAKNLKKAEADSLKAAGLGIALVGEITPNRALGGAAQGRADMQTWMAQAKDLGAPEPNCIYMAVDFDATDAQMNTVVAYIKGGAEVRNARWTGVYGSYRVVEACRKADACHYLWQTYAWSGGKWSGAAQLQQYKNNVALGNATVDLCRATVADYGQWGASGEWWED
jgi:hypothetical protein